MPQGKKLIWSPRKMRLAIEEVKTGSLLRKTAEKYGVPVMTLHDHVKKGPEYKPRLGGKPVFTTEQEAEIRDELIKLSKMFYGLTLQALRRSVYRYAERNKMKHPFNLLILDNLVSHISLDILRILSSKRRTDAFTAASYIAPNSAT